jgi:hypothetical protein
LVEQMTVNHWVLGSNPRGGAKFKKGCRNAALFFCLSESRGTGRKFAHKLRNHCL